MKSAPAADPADGRLDLVVLGDLGRLELLRWLPTVYRGRHLANPKVRARAARRVTIRPARPLPVHVDGEIAPATPVRSEEHTSELQSQSNLVCRLLLEKKNKRLMAS